MTGRLPRDRWVGASPGGNVTPQGKAREALDRIRELARERDLSSADIEAIVADTRADSTETDQ